MKLPTTYLRWWLLGKVKEVTPPYSSWRSVCALLWLALVSLFCYELSMVSYLHHTVYYKMQIIVRILFSK